MRNFGANIRPAAIIDEGIGRCHRTPGCPGSTPGFSTGGPVSNSICRRPPRPACADCPRALIENLADIGAGATVSAIFARVGRACRFSGSRLASCSICFGLISFDKSWLAPGFGMSLTLAMLRCPDDVAPETRTVAGGEFSIGRAPENDWVLPDPERALSKRHCVLTFLAGGWQVADHSTNGTFLNREAEPIGRGQSRELRSGDRLSFGAYEIEVHVEEEGLAPRRTAPADPFAAHRSATPELFALDPFAAASERDESGVRPGSAAGRRGRASTPPRRRWRKRPSPCRRISTRSPLIPPSARSAARPSRITLRISRTPSRRRCPRPCCPTIGTGKSRRPGSLGYVRRNRRRSPFRLSQARPRRLPSRFRPCSRVAPSEAVTAGVTAPPRMAPARIAAARAEAPAGPGIE